MLAALDDNCDGLVSVADLMDYAQRGARTFAHPDEMDALAASTSGFESADLSPTSDAGRRRMTEKQATCPRSRAAVWGGDLEWNPSVMAGLCSGFRSTTGALPARGRRGLSTRRSPSPKFRSARSLPRAHAAAAKAPSSARTPRAPPPEATPPEADPLSAGRWRNLYATTTPAAGERWRGTPGQAVRRASRQRLPPLNREAAANRGSRAEIPEEACDEEEEEAEVSLAGSHGVSELGHG